MSAAAVHVVVPSGIDDPARPSGGNRYDREVLDGLRARGRPVVEHAVGRTWPRPSVADRCRLAQVVTAVPDGAVLLVDGLVASAAATELVPAAARVRTVVLVHLPLATAGEGEVLRSATAVVTTSAHTAAEVTALHGLPAGSVYTATPGVSPAAAAAPDPAGRRLLVVGAVSAAKGHDVLVGALAGLRDLDWFCDVVGPLDREPSFVAALRERVARAGLDARLRLTGTRTGAALDAHYAGADLLVLPSRGETYGMVVTEALARGLPVVGSDVGGVPEALGTTPAGPPGTLVRPGDPALLGATIRRWLSDVEVRDAWRAAARRRRPALAGWDVTVDELVAVLDRAGSLGD